MVFGFHGKNEECDVFTYSNTVPLIVWGMTIVKQVFVAENCTHYLTSSSLSKMDVSTGKLLTAV